MFQKKKLETLRNITFRGPQKGNHKGFLHFFPSHSMAGAEFEIPCASYNKIAVTPNLCSVKVTFQSVTA